VNFHAGLFHISNILLLWCTLCCIVSEFMDHMYTVYLTTLTTVYYSLPCTAYFLLFAELASFFALQVRLVSQCFSKAELFEIVGAGFLSTECCRTYCVVNFTRDLLYGSWAGSTHWPVSSLPSHQGMKSNRVKRASLHSLLC